MNEKYVVKTDSVPAQKQMIFWADYRISVLTSRLFRVEKNAQHDFTDEPTQRVWFRNLSDVKFNIKESAGKCEIKTNDVTLVLFEGIFKNGYIKFANRNVKLNNAGNLKGTTRTLDLAVGEVDLCDGIVSKKGVAILQDNSLVLQANGELATRDLYDDYYIFAYDNDYRGALKDFYRLTGASPMLPRYCLGNWWSRYWRYTDTEYLNLLDKFDKNNIPISVATLDMDWHYVDIENAFNITAQGLNDNYYGGTRGWTGFSWHRGLFPNPKNFLDKIKNDGHKVTLNLHPADGVRWFEDCYSSVAEAMGVDATDKKRINFDIADPKFISAYFDKVLRPLENDGVDFWWIDWQQGTSTKIDGLDPLWALNHYHYLDNMSEGKRPLILSRYAEWGSHRYPLGFSGDTDCSWKLFKFIPYFTSTASNIGFTFWSHDIGGHHNGVKDDELYIRWLEFGVFNPILRLHSTSTPLTSKEPWNYYKGTELLAGEQLRLRNQFIPYIYSAVFKNYANGQALTEPMYYAYPNSKQSYTVKNQYMFGEKLLVCPITEKCDKILGVAKSKVWLPGGRWTDIFTGKAYNGETTVTMYRDISSIPVLACEGAIIPISETPDKKACNPKNITYLVYRGNGNYELYEDDGETEKYKSGAYAITYSSVIEKDNSVTFKMLAPKGDKSVVPCNRTIKICFRDILGGNITVLRNDIEDSDSKIKIENGVNVEIFSVNASENIEILIKDYIAVTTQNSYKKACVSLLSKYNADNNFKLQTAYPFIAAQTLEQSKEIINLSNLPKIVKDALSELML